MLKGKALLQGERWLKLSPAGHRARCAGVHSGQRRGVNRHARVKKAWIGLAAGGVLVALVAGIYALHAELGRQKDLLTRSLVDRARTISRLALEDGDSQHRG